MALEDFMKMANKDNQNPEDMDKIKAKMEVIEDLRRMASDMMGEGLSDGLKKVTVASPTEEGLSKGLEKAEDIVENDDMLADQDEEMMDEEYSSPEEIDAKIAELMELKKQLMGE